MPRFDTFSFSRMQSAHGVSRHQTRSFIVLAATFILLLTIDLAACWGAIEIVNGTRAYAVGEGRYSKQQKIAVLALDRFIDTRSRADYEAFLSATEVPRGDRDARVALQTKPFDRSAAISGLLRGQNNLDDADILIHLFQAFSWWKPFAAAVSDWAEGDRLVDSLVQLGAEIRAEPKQGDEASRAADRAKVGRIDDVLTDLETTFSTHMSEAARGATHLVVAGLGITTALLWAVGVLFASRLFRRQVVLDRQLGSSEQRFRDYAEVASDWYWEVDRDRKLTFLSERYFTLTGTSPLTVLGKDATEFLRTYAADADSWTRLAPFMSRRAIRGVRLRYPKADGGIIYLSVSAKPYFDEKGQFGGYRGVGSDVTAAAEAAQALSYAKERAEIANRAKSEFLANMSHELRTPLNAIIGFSEIIMNRVLGPGHAERYDGYARDINVSGKHLLSVIEEILDLSKIESGREELAESDVDLDELVTAAVLPFSRRFAKAGLSLTRHTPVPPVMLLADGPKLQRCLSNLLSNALKFTPAGGAVAVRAFFDDRGDLTLSVTDTGIGIASGDMQTVMSAFGQVETAFQRAHPGSGLGIPMTRALIELHGGAFHIESRFGAGTTVTLILPGSRVAGQVRGAVAIS